MELTWRSAEEYDRLCHPFTPAAAAEYLREGRVCARSFGETLRSMYPHDDLQPLLCAAFREAESDANAGSVARNVRNWLAGRSQPASREMVFIIAFALELSEEQAGFLLGLCTGYGIHYRDGRDVVYAWFLRNRMRYVAARDFFASLPEAPRYKLPPDGASPHLSRELQNIFLYVRTPEELRRAYLDNLDSFGVLHARAYHYFSRYFDLLIQPDPARTEGHEQDYSVEAVARLYLTLRMPSSRSRRGYNAVQKLLKRDWPNATSLKNIRSRREDVPRKLLLLLYVITENVIDGEYSELDEEYLTVEDRLEDHWWALNAMLTDCGMPLMDPRNASDWLVLYAVTAVDEPMSQRMEEVIEYMFSDEK